jgi:ArsR family transcriptional regulator, arsenate/arsenite/antimonite-responsive transcriptional repressor
VRTVTHSDAAARREELINVACYVDVMSALPLERSAPELAEQARAFHALSDPRRLQILAVLRDGERCVCDLQADLGLAQSLLSFHLKTLRDAGLVSVRRSGRWAHYSLSIPALRQVGSAIAELRQPVDDHGDDTCCTS